MLDRIDLVQNDEARVRATSSINVTMAERAAKPRGLGPSSAIAASDTSVAAPAPYAT